MVVNYRLAFRIMPACPLSSKSQSKEPRRSSFVCGAQKIFYMQKARIIFWRRKKSNLVYAAKEKSLIIA